MSPLLQRSLLSSPTEAKEAFALFDKRGAGTIPKSSLGDVLRALGQNPTQKEVADLASQAGQDSEFSRCWTEREELMSEEQLTTTRSCPSCTDREGSSLLGLLVRVSLSVDRKSVV